MSEEKTMPEWGDVLHVDGDPVLVVRIKGGSRVDVADRFGKWHGFLMEDFDEYKPRTITINGIKVPEPVRKPLYLGQKYWVADISERIPHSSYWEGCSVDYRWLENGLIHLTRENAEAHRNAMLRANKGESE
jgi:hypothetical protein